MRPSGAGDPAGQSSSSSRPLVSGSNANRPVHSSTGTNVTTPPMAQRLPTSATAPNSSRPTTPPSTAAATFHPATDARTDVGNSSLASAPAAGANRPPETAASS